MNFTKLLIGLLIFLSSNQFLFSQPAPWSGGDRIDVQYKLSHPLRFGTENKVYSPKHYFTQPDTIKIVAILVEFQEDDNPLTTGNGKFDLSNKYYNPSTGRDTVIDSPPYDSSYFADHLEFMRNYFYKSSKGKLNISYDLFGQVITLPKKMEEYSPQRNESNIKIGNLYQDAWAIADSFIDFSGYDKNKTAFVIFHAGTGRDVNLAGIFGFDPTPFDIPSLYIGLNNLHEFYGSNYNGIQTGEGLFIQNSLVIPSTENRELTSFGETFLVELGINGILCANFGSYLELPDLFDTRTGNTRIGRFGLMDGESIFSYRGVFPPEPSAWEKIYLGWVDAVEIGSGDSQYSVRTASNNFNTANTIYKVLINSKEYFLIENRNRDADNNGVKIKIRNRDNLDSIVVLQDQDNFFNTPFNSDITILYGNIVDVDDLDWSLPGFIDQDNNFKGGILIWHIDENIIETNLASNSINNDIDRKGVDLEEAKGAQQIGTVVNTIVGSVVLNGFPVDFWYDGDHQVPSNIYQNQFTPNSTPNSLSNNFTNNRIYITDISSVDSVMTFRARIGDEEIKPLAGFPKNIGIHSNRFLGQPVSFDLNNNGSVEFFINNGEDLFGFRNDGTSITGDPGGVLLPSFGYTPPSIAFMPLYNSENRLIAISNSGSSSQAGYYNYDVNYQVTSSDFDNFPAGYYISAAPLVFDTSKAEYGFVTGNIYEKNFSTSGAPSSFIDSVNNSILQFTRSDQSNFNFSTYINFISTGNIVSNNSIDTIRIVNSKNIFINGSLLSNNYNFDTITHSPVLADLNRDGKQEILIVADGKIYALNGNGVLLDNFPVDFGKKVTSGISVADINNDGNYDIIFCTYDGDLYAYGMNGETVGGFPVKAGTDTYSTPSIINLSGNFGILVYGGDGYLYAFRTGFTYDESKVIWKNYLKDRHYSNNNFKSEIVPPVFSEKLPKDKVYNWPNPVYDNNTFIRYYLNGNANEVIIKIVDLSGELITTLNGTSFSNSENEVAWNVSEVQSGIYYGIVEANIDGSKVIRTIKIAVVK
jgi:hypothetical protein